MKVGNIAEVKSSARVQRVAVHSHIRGLGLGPNGKAENNNIMVGQEDAREAAGVAVSMIQAKRMAGRALLLAGPSSSGKTALAMAVCAELGVNVPFCPMVASEVYSAEVKKTEVLMENFRRAIGLRIREMKEVYEGEVVDMAPHEIDNPLGGYGKTIAHVTLTLRATAGTRSLKLDPSVYEALQKERVQIGDVIFIEANSGAVKRVGRCDKYTSASDLDVEEYVAIPKGDVHKKKEVVQDVTLHDLDMASARPQGGQDIMAMVSQMGRQRKTEITEKLRHEINKTVNQYVDQGAAEVVPGVLFVDEVHMLDIECFAFLNRALESPLAPIVIFATNRGTTTINGTDDVLSPYGIPRDLLDRLMVIQTHSYDRDAIRSILLLRIEEEAKGIFMEKAVEALTNAGVEESLRYAMQLVTPSVKIMEMDEPDEKVVSEEHVKEASSLFMSAKQSCAYLERATGYL